MKIAFMCALILIVCEPAFAESIYKWTDENGKVHYGDNKDASKTNTQRIRVIGASSSNVSTGASSNNVSASENNNNSTPIDAGALQRCLAMARTMVNKKTTNPSEIRADSKSLLDICPGTAYECVTYIERPEANSCKAVPMTSGGSITNNVIYQR